MTNLEWIKENKGDVHISFCKICWLIKNLDEEICSNSCPTYIELFDWLMQEHKEPIEFTEDEKTILRNVDNRYGWIARDEIGNLYVYTEKPTKSIVAWHIDLKHIDLKKEDCVKLDLFNRLFQQIQWADDEPVNFREVLENEEKHEDKTHIERLDKVHSTNDSLSCIPLLG